MSGAVIVAAIVIVLMFGGAGAYYVSTGVIQVPNGSTTTCIDVSAQTTTTQTCTSYTLSAISTTVSTITITNITSTGCSTTVTGYMGNFRGSYPNGTQWISIDGHSFQGNSIVNGTLPNDQNSNSPQHWWVISSC